MKNLILFTFIFLSVFGYAQTPDCKKFKNGTFIYPQIPDYGYSIRENETQRSYIKSKDMWVIWTVKWIDDCKFDLIFKEASNNDGTYNIGDKISVTIISSEKDCYKFSSVFFSTKNPEGKKMPIGEMCLKQK